MTDPIADMLTRIRNALLVKKTEVLIPFSKIKYAIAKILEQKGFIAGAEKTTSRKKNKFADIKIILQYDEQNAPIIQGLKRISKPGCRIYAKAKELKRNDYKTLILSTSRGLMTAEEAKKRKLGGEVLCEIW